jgi:hypothetical protein
MEDSINSCCENMVLHGSGTLKMRGAQVSLWVWNTGHGKLELLALSRANKGWDNIMCAL